MLSVLSVSLSWCNPSRKSNLPSKPFERVYFRHESLATWNNGRRFAENITLQNSYDDSDRANNNCSGNAFAESTACWITERKIVPSFVAQPFVSHEGIRSHLVCNSSKLSCWNQLPYGRVSLSPFALSPFLPSFLCECEAFLCCESKLVHSFSFAAGWTEVVTPNYQFPEPEMELVSIKSNLVIPRGVQRG